MKNLLEIGGDTVHKNKYRRLSESKHSPIHSNAIENGFERFIFLPQFPWMADPLVYQKLVLPPALFHVHCWRSKQCSVCTRSRNEAAQRVVK